MNRLIMIALCVLVPSIASAQESERPSVPTGSSAPADVPNTQHIVSITFSPIHLISPILELTGEIRILRDLSAALIVGAGKVSTETSDGVVIDSYTAFEGGGQLRYYVLGDFEHGMQLGAEAIYLYLDRDGNSSIQVSGAGFAFGPFVGYKIATDIGFTFDAQLGVEYLVASGNASDGTNSASAEESNIIPLLNLNVGWSF